MKKKYKNSIEEVRAVKEDLARKAHYDAKQFMQLVKDMTQDYDGQVQRPKSRKSGLRTGTDG